MPVDHDASLEAGIAIQPFRMAAKTASSSKSVMSELMQGLADPGEPCVSLKRAGLAQLIVDRGCTLQMLDYQALRRLRQRHQREVHNEEVVLCLLPVALRCSEGLEERQGVFEPEAGRTESGGHDCDVAEAVVRHGEIACKTALLALRAASVLLMARCFSRWLVRPGPIEVPPLAGRMSELPRIVDEYVLDAIVEVAPPRSLALTERDRQWLIEHAATRGLSEIEKAALRLVALPSSINMSHAAARLGMASVSLTRWAARGRLPTYSYAASAAWATYTGGDRDRVDVVRRRPRDLLDGRPILSTVDDFCDGDGVDKPAATRERSEDAVTQSNSLSEPLARAAAEATTADEQLTAFEIFAGAELTLPADGHVVGEPVRVTRIHYAGQPRIGLLATCHRGEHTYDVNLADLVFPHASAAAKLVARYRAWLGFDPADDVERAVGHARPHKVASDDIAVGTPVELAVLACKSNALRCRLLGSAREVTLRTAVRYEIPGSIITVTPTKQWMHARHPYLSGAVERMRVDVFALGLVPLALRTEGEWDPEDEYWGEEGDPIGEWTKPIIARGKRPAFEMEQVIPGADPDDFDSDPIIEASEHSQAGDPAGAREILMKLLAEDLRCLDAHAHLGNLEFERAPKQAVRHYEMGVSIGALSLGTSFDGVLPWGHIDNRPFLRCLNGTGLCAWRLGDRRSAAAVFKKMLWLNPGDNQGARFNLAAVEAGKTWEEMEYSEQ